MVNPSVFPHKLSGNYYRVTEFPEMAIQMEVNPAPGNRMIKFAVILNITTEVYHSVILKLFNFIHGYG